MIIIRLHCSMNTFLVEQMKARRMAVNTLSEASAYPIGAISCIKLVVNIVPNIKNRTVLSMFKKYGQGHYKLHSSIYLVLRSTT